LKGRGARSKVQGQFGEDTNPPATVVSGERGGVKLWEKFRRMSRHRILYFFGGGNVVSGAQNWLGKKRQVAL